MITPHRWTRSLPGAVLVTAALMLALAPAFAAAQESGAVDVFEHDTHGSILVTAEGMALYVQSGDEEIDESIWPALTVPSGTNLDTDLDIGSIEHAPTGDLHVTLDGQPLYTFTSDTVAGEVAGDEVEGWAVATVQTNGDDNGDENGNDDPPAESGFTEEPTSGVTLTQYTGSMADLEADAAEYNLTAVWGTVGGEWVGHVFGAPDFVNADFAEHYGDSFDAEPLVAVAP